MNHNHCQELYLRMFILCHFFKHGHAAVVKQTIFLYQHDNKQENHKPKERGTMSLATLKRCQAKVSECQIVDP